MKLQSNPAVQKVFDAYPEHVKPLMLQLRSLILETASNINDLTELEETLKWEEPSFLTKYGSTIRIDWKPKNPDYYAVYFKCTSQLVPSFKALYGTIFEFEKNRAILFKLDDTIPEKALKHCISLALTYHKIKHLPLLGA